MDCWDCALCLLQLGNFKARKFHLPSATILRLKTPRLRTQNWSRVFLPKHLAKTKNISMFSLCKGIITKPDLRKCCFLSSLFRQVIANTHTCSLGGSFMLPRSTETWTSRGLFARLAPACSLESDSVQISMRRPSHCGQWLRCPTRFRIT